MSWLIFVANRLQKLLLCLFFVFVFALCAGGLFIIGLLSLCTFRFMVLRIEVRHCLHIF